MKSLSTLLASVAFALLASCGSSRQGVASQPPVSPPSGGNVVSFGTHTAHVYANSVHFISVAPTAFEPVEVRVYNLDEDAAGTYDCLWVQRRQGDPWTYYQNLNLHAGVKATEGRTRVKDAMIWFGHAADARARAKKKAPQTTVPAKPAPEPKKDEGLWYTPSSLKSKATKPKAKPVSTIKPKGTSMPVRTAATRGKQPAEKQMTKVSKQKAKTEAVAKESQDDKAAREKLSRLLDHKTEQNQADIAASRGEPAPQIPVVDIKVEND